jgi:hypothetical protein
VAEPSAAVRRTLASGSAALFLLALASGCSGGGGSSSPAACELPDPAPPAASCLADPRLGPAPPGELAYDLAGVSDAAAQEAVECFAWESFAALNWPAASGCRGVPDLDASLGPQQRLSVFETFKAPYELFQPTDPRWRSRAVAWDDAVPDSGPCGSPVATGAVDDAPSMDQVIYENSPGFLDSSAVVADQNGNTVTYTLGLNQDAFEYLRDQGFAETGAYDFGGPLPADRRVRFPDNRDGATGYGAIEVKAAWRTLTDSEDRQRYVTRTAKVYDAAAGCTVQTVGLVGLHIVRKVAGQPKWIWTTFEHVDNTPPVDARDTDRSYAFYSQSCAENVPDDCYWAIVAAAPTDSVYTCCPNILMEVAWLGAPNQITRLEPIPARADVNATFQAALAARESPLQYYFLVGAQWARPSRPDPAAFERPCNPNGAWRVPPPAPGAPCYQQIPAHVRNSVIEAYNIANDTNGGQSLTDSCMNCHWATGVDGSFVWLDAMSNPYPLH